MKVKRGWLAVAVIAGLGGIAYDVDGQGSTYYNTVTIHWNYPQNGSYFQISSGRTVNLPGGSGLDGFTYVGPLVPGGTYTKSGVYFQYLSTGPWYICGGANETGVGAVYATPVLATVANSQYYDLYFVGTSNYYWAVSGPVLNDTATTAYWRLSTNGVCSGPGVSCGPNPFSAGNYTGPYSNVCSQPFTQLFEISTLPEGPWYTDPSWTLLGTNGVMLATNAPATNGLLGGFVNSPFPTYSGASNTVVWGSNAYGSGDSAIYSALIQIGQQAHNDSLSLSNAFRSAGSGGTGGNGSNSVDVLNMWTNGLTLEQLTNTISWSGPYSAQYNSWWAQNSSQMGASTGAVGSALSAFASGVSSHIGSSEVDTPVDSALLDVDLLSGTSVPHVTVRTDNSSLSTVGAAMHILFGWLAIFLLYAKCVIWTMESLEAATRAPQGTTAGETVLGTNLNGAFAFGFGVLIVAGLAVLPSVLAGVIDTLFQTMGVGTVAAARPASLSSALGGQSYALLCRMFPVGVWITCALNYPVAKVGISYVVVVYSALVRLMSGI